MNSSWVFEYPVWDLGFWGGGLLIAVIAVLHVYIAHFAVGGGLFLVLTEMKGYRENSQAILDYTKKHTRFFLLLTMVFGAVSGVGIWFVISLLSPSATSILVHYYVFGWATEWIFFVGEIVALFVYYYTFGKMNKRQHLTVGWIYFLFGWLSLFVINGIITLMLTPGVWLETYDFWHGFFNPTFLSSLLFRTFMALMLAGLFGLVTSASLKQDECGSSLTRYCALWTLIPLCLMMLSGWLLISDLPLDQKDMILNRSPEILPFMKAFVWICAGIFLGGFFLAFKSPTHLPKPLAIGMALIGLLCIGSFEWIREAGRRPYIIYGYEYSNAVRVRAVPQVLEKGVLASARWVQHRKITEENRLEAGKEVYRLLCLSCHSIGGPMNDILPLTQKYSLEGMDSLLTGMGKINAYMPIFMGNADERKALAAYIVTMLHGKTEAESAIPEYETRQIEIPPFNSETDEYVLLAWTDYGMQHLSDCDRFFSLAAPETNVNAILIKRGESPELMSDADLTYQIEDGFGNPSKQTDFWNYSSSLTGTPQNPLPVKGSMVFDDKRQIFRTGKIPVVPYSDQGRFYPYPTIRVEARDKQTGNKLAAVKTVAPVSTEMGCKNCHGGSWKRNDTAGISDETAVDILKTHDRLNRTQLLKQAKAGQPKSCSECHASYINSNSGKDQHLSLSASIHGFHANYMTHRGADACASCHPSDGFTKGFRGIHLDVGMDCTNCHGKLEDHAASLLMGEQKAGKKMAGILMKHLKPSENISPRMPWVNLPDCLNCHVDFEPPETDTSELNQWTASDENLYRMRTDNTGIMCTACHGAPHAEYPASNPFGTDNLPPRQYQNSSYPIAANKNCSICHQKNMDDPVHHPNSLNMFRNTK